MKTENEVFQLAQDKGYKPILCHIAKYGGSATLPRTITDEAGQLCELTLIQKWLREHKLEVRVQCCGSIDNYLYQIFLPDEGKCLKFAPNTTDTYEQALLEGIHEALKTTYETL